MSNYLDLGYNSLLGRTLVVDLSTINNANSDALILSGAVSYSQTTLNTLQANEDIESKGFKTGVTGWKLYGDGNAEFVGITLSGGTLKYGKTSFTDSTHSGYIIDTNGLYVGSPSNSSYLKYTISSNTLAFKGSITITGGTGISNLTDAGNLATLDSIGASNCDTTIISGGKIITGLLTADNIQVGTLQGITLIGNTIKTNNSSTPYAKMDSNGISIFGETAFQFMDPDYEPAAWIGIDSLGNLQISSFSYTYPNADLSLTSRDTIKLTAGSHVELATSLYPDVNNNYDIGNPGAAFAAVYAGELYCGTKYFYSYELSGTTRLYSSSDFVASGSLHCSGNVYTGGVNGASGGLNAGQLYLAPTSVNPSSYGQIRNYASGSIDQFRGIPGDGTWAGSFDMTAY